MDEIDWHKDRGAELAQQMPSQQLLGYIAALLESLLFENRRHLEEIRDILAEDSIEVTGEVTVSPARK